MLNLPKQRARRALPVAYRNSPETPRTWAHARARTRARAHTLFLQRAPAKPQSSSSPGSPWARAPDTPQALPCLSPVGAGPVLAAIYGGTSLGSFPITYCYGWLVVFSNYTEACNPCGFYNHQRLQKEVTYAVACRLQPFMASSQLISLQS